MTSLVVITSIVTVRRAREAPAEAHPGTSFARAAEFEVRVAQTLEKEGFVYQAAVNIGSAEADFVVETPRGPIVLEVKAWKNAVPLSILQRTLNLARRLRQEFKAADAFIVIPDTRMIPRTYLEGEGDSFITLKELPARLRSPA